MNIHRPPRKSPRLQGYDYAQSGAYFVTMCVQHRICLFGTPTPDEWVLNSSGNLIEDYWAKLPSKFPELEIDYSVVMPNHFHGIVILKGIDLSSTSLPQAMRWFKTMTTNAYIHGVKEQGWESFEGKLWQRSYHDHIIRNERELNILREYILINPAKWQEDSFYSGSKKSPPTHKPPIS
jgi:putative transposase